jgi:hypothetical protein
VKITPAADNHSAAGVAKNQKAVTHTSGTSPQMLDASEKSEINSGRDLDAGNPCDRGHPLGRIPSLNNR